MQPTKIRLLTAAMLTVMACLLYLDRYAVGIASQRMRSDLQMTQTQMSWFLSSFFWAYALSQVPAGWLSDRFGPRMMLAAFIVGWSLFTGLLGATTIVALILLWRFLCGTTQAGAFPVASGMIRSWFPVGQRGLASSVVAVGGRVGAVVAPLLTAQLMATFDGRWQMVLMLYGGAGIVVALAFALSCRDTPAGHPLCNDEERSLIAGPPWDKHPCLSETNESQSAASHAAISTAEPAKPPFPLVAIITSVSLWGNSLLQLFTNIGWLFVVTWLPRYLEEVHEVPLGEQALMTAAPTAAGIVGMLGGGWWTDWAARRFGLKWGRRVPVLTTRFSAAAGYAACLVLSLWTPDPTTRWLPWCVVACLSFATFSCDLGVPAVWAYAQDVGGQFTASIMGWANMWGNIGAALAPLIYNAVLGETPTVANWNALFIACAAAFALSGFAALVLDSTKPIAFEKS